jgi:hypothetical protein
MVMIMNALMKERNMKMKKKITMRLSIHLFIRVSRITENTLGA